MSLGWALTNECQYTSESGASTSGRTFVTGSGCAVVLHCALVLSIMIILYFKSLVTLAML